MDSDILGEPLKLNRHLIRYLRTLSRMDNGDLLKITARCKDEEVRSVLKSILKGKLGE